MNIISPKLILAIVLLILSCPSAYAETNALGQPINIHGDETNTPAPRLPSYPSVETQSLPPPETWPESAAPEISSEALPELTTEPPETIDIESIDLWQRIKNGYAIPASTSSLVAKHEKFFSSNPEYVKRMVERSQKYLFHIVEEVERRGLPTEIALLPMIESGYNPQAYSRSRASGIWQFMPDTGKFFGLKQNWWVDHRRDVTIATDAALTYLQKLHDMFGSWDLALAAYNAGEGTVSRAIEKNRKLGLGTDYYSLNLPVETKNYVPKLQAMKNLMTDPGKYGLEIQTIANTAYFTRVSAPPQIDAHLAAKLAEISDVEFAALNPGFNRPVIASQDGKHELLLPIASAQTFRENLAAYNKPLVTWQTYSAKRGERIDSIANKFGVGADKIRSANNLSSSEKLHKSATILVPNVNAQNHTGKTDTSNAHVASTDDIEILANQNAGNIDLAKAEKQAALAAEEVERATEKVSENPKKTEVAKPVLITHTVKKGETLQAIARRYDMSVKQILAANTLKSTQVKVGQTLKIKQDIAEKTSQPKVKPSEKSKDNQNNDENQAKTKDKSKLKEKSKLKSRDKSDVKSSDKSSQQKVKLQKTKTEKSKTAKQTKTKAKKK